MIIIYEITNFLPTYLREVVSFKINFSPSFTLRKTTQIIEYLNLASTIYRVVWCGSFWLPLKLLPIHVRFYFLPEHICLPHVKVELLLIFRYPLKIKRSGEMARKLRFFREQMSKAGLVAQVRSSGEAIANIDDLEVSLAFCKSFS